jgi:mRNA degradation ribonuclease J1/J2
VLPSSVLGERAALASHGAAHVSIPIDARGRLAGDIALVTRGVVDDALDGHVLASARTEVLASVEALLGDIDVAPDRTSPAPPGRGQTTDEQIAEAARQAVRRALGRMLGFKPVATATVLRVHR